MLVLNFRSLWNHGLIMQPTTPVKYPVLVNQKMLCGIQGDPICTWIYLIPIYIFRVTRRTQAREKHMNSAFPIRKPLFPVKSETRLAPRDFHVTGKSASAKLTSAVRKHSANGQGDSIWEINNRMAAMILENKLWHNSWGNQTIHQICCLLQWTMISQNKNQDGRPKRTNLNFEHVNPRCQSGILLGIRGVAILVSYLYMCKFLSPAWIFCWKPRDHVSLSKRSVCYQ